MDSGIIMINKLNKWIKDNEYIINLIISRQTRMKENAINHKIRYLWTCRYLEIKQIAEEDGIDFAQIPEEMQKGVI